MPEIYNAHQKEKEVVVDKRIIEKRKRRISKIKAQPTTNPLASFAVFPRNTTFATQEKEEDIVLLLRQHPVINLGWIIAAFLLLIAPAALDYIPIISFLPDRFQAMTLVLWYFMVMIFVVSQFLFWYFNVYIVTDERIVDIDFYGLIYRDLTVTKIDKIQDINFTQGGLFGSFFNFGDVNIQTAGERVRLDFLKVPQPARVVEILSQLIDEEEQESHEGRVK